MINLKTLFIALFLSIFCCSCGQNTSKTISPEEQQKIDTAINAIKKEERVKDFHLEELWSATQWNVGVIPTKQSEYSFAAHICDILGDHDLNPEKQIVRIVDITKVIREQVPAKMASLKRIKCETYMIWSE